MISIKYLEVISILNKIEYAINCKYFIFSNSEEIFIKYNNSYDDYFHCYKLIKNELILYKKYYFEKKLNELEEIDNKGNYSILYQDYNLWQEYYIKNNINEDYLYPMLKEIKINPISKRCKEKKKYMERSKYTWDENPKNKDRYFGKKNDNFYFEKALYSAKKKKRLPKEQKIEHKKEGEENGEKFEEKKEGEEEDIKGKGNKEFDPKGLKEEEEKEKEIKATQDDKLLNKVEKKEENILLASGPRKKKGKKKIFKELNNIKTNFTEKDIKERKRQRRGIKIFVYNEEDFPELK